MTRFLAVGVGGLIVDISVAWLLIDRSDFADIPAAALGLFAGMIFNYFLHLKWTFREVQRRPSLKHFVRFAVGVAVTLVVRAGVLMVIQAANWQSLLAPPVRLGIAAALSFFLSYAISRYLVFGPAGEDVNRKIRK